MTVVAIVLALAVSAVGIALFARAAAGIVGVVRLGQPVVDRRDRPGQRWKHLATETLGHTRMLQWSTVGIAHWFVFVAFGALFFTLVTAYGQLFDPRFALPIIGHWVVYEWASEIIAWAGLISIVLLTVIRARSRHEGRGSRFYGSRGWMGVFVELVILGIVVCVLALRALEYQLLGAETSRWHFPLTWFLLPGGIAASTLATAIILVAALKIIVSMSWFVVIGLHQTMGVAWHRFTVWPNIWFKRESSGRPALGALPPIVVDGKPLDFAEIEDLDEDAALGVAKIEDFSWKGLLDLTSCTECGRCQSVCPAWHTGKPLSPKLLVMDLREHAYAKAPYLQTDPADRDTLPAAVQLEAQRSLVGPIQVGEDGVPGVIDPDVLWSCTNCGACVQECPVDIEHVDHIGGMRRHQVMVESEFPKQLNGLFKGLENKGNPWSMNARGRLDWTKGLPFTVPVVGKDVDDLTQVDYLFWVGCAGAFEDRAKKTTQAIAELLHTAGVRYAVLGNGETCTGDPARRAGNEFLFAAAGHGERRDAERGQGDQDRHQLRPLPQLAAQRIPAVRSLRRGRPPHPAAQPAGPRGQAHPGRSGRGREPLDHLPRPVLPRSSQRDLRAAARTARRHPRSQGRGDGTHQGALVLLRRRGRPDVDGGGPRHPDQRQPDRRGGPHARRRRERGHRHRLPLLPGHVERRPDQRTGRRNGPAVDRGPRCRPTPARVGPPRSAQH